MALLSSIATSPVEPTYDCAQPPSGNIADAVSFTPTHAGDHVRVDVAVARAAEGLVLLPRVEADGLLAVSGAGPRGWTVHLAPAPTTIRATATCHDAPVPLEYPVDPAALPVPRAPSPGAAGVRCTQLAPHELVRRLSGEARVHGPLDARHAEVRLYADFGVSGLRILPDLALDGTPVAARTTVNDRDLVATVPMPGPDSTLTGRIACDGVAVAWEARLDGVVARGRAPFTPRPAAPSR